MAPKTPLDDMLHTLSDVHRRRLLVSLLECNPRSVDVRINEAAHGGEKTVARHQMRMFHLHLPHLEEAGFVRWKRDEDEVAKGPKFEEIRPLIELMDDHADELPTAWV